MIYIYFHYSWRLIITSKLHTHTTQRQRIHSKLQNRITQTSRHNRPCPSPCAKGFVWRARGGNYYRSLSLARQWTRLPALPERKRERDRVSPSDNGRCGRERANREWRVSERERGDVSDGLPRFMGILSARLSRAYAVPREPRLVVWRNDVHYKVDAAARRAYSGFC